MATSKNHYICQECGFKSPKWMGRCTNCGSWNSFEEIEGDTATTKHEEAPGIRAGDITPSPITGVKGMDRSRLDSGIRELDRVLGGGIVAGSLTLVGGAPGIGKSTLILQVAFLFSKNYGRVLYVSGEESPRQIKLRARRLEALSEDLMIVSETDFSAINQYIQQHDDFKLVIVDSIQTMHDHRQDSTPGSVAQVKEITNQLLKTAKTTGIPVVLIGHVTKQGELAGPRVLEHLVDCVLQLEGAENYSYRILRAIKNRFGSTNEIGVFKMEETGLEEVKNPSQLFLSERPENVSGSVIVPVIEGTRTILVEVQALISAAAFNVPQRLTTGMDRKRVSILLAVLEKKVGFNFKERDVHLNITGGLEVREPGLDLGIVTAIISSEKDYTLPDDMAVIGEVGLAGEVRAVSRIKSRLSELQKMGFRNIVIPEGNLQKLDFRPEMNLQGVKNLQQLLDLVFI